MDGNGQSICNYIMQYYDIICLMVELCIRILDSIMSFMVEFCSWPHGGALS